MNKGLVSGILIGLLALFVVFLSPANSMNFPRHKNPAQIQEELFFPIQLISIYAQVVSLQIAGKWDLASSQLKKTFLAYIPEPLRYIFTRFNELIQAAGDKLRTVKKSIDSAKALLHQGKIEKSGKILEDAWETVLKIERDLNNLNSSIDELRGKIGGAASEKLRKEITPLSKLAKDYKNKIQILYRQVKEGKRLEDTFLQISVSKRKIVVGNSFEIYGKLTAEKERSLAGKKVDLFLERKRILKVVTNENGEFKAKIDFPFIYKRYAQVFASFTPQEEDKKKFYPSTSNKILLEPVFYTPLIKAGYEKPIYPVLPFKLQGKLTLEDLPLVKYPVKIRLSQKVIQINTNEEGKFETQLSLPSGVGRTFPLRIFTPSRGIIGPASLTINLPVSYKVPSMMIDLPLVVTPPFPLELKGEVNLEGDVMKEPIVRVITEGEDVKTFVRGENFKVRLNLPLSRFSGWEKIRILLHPREAWISSLNREEKVLVINPVTLLPFIGLLVLFIGMSSQRKKESEETERVLGEREKVIPEEKVAEKKEVARLIRVYTEATDLVAHLSGVKQAPGHTIREYLKLVKDKLGEKGEDFELISLITEKFLYSSIRISEEEVAEAEKRLSRLKVG